MPKADAQAPLRVREAIGAALERLTPGEEPTGLRALVAFSGGLDSTVLLHALASTAGPARIHAVHVHHGLQDAADAWPAHSRDQALALGTGFTCVRLTARPTAGEGIEAWARRERYAALGAQVRQLGCAVVMTGHHADDQAETVLLRLARGAGVLGLGAMASTRRHDNWQLVRPLLALSRADLLAYAQAHRLTWIEDPSNTLTEFARNRVRREVLPALMAAVPGAVGNLNRAARLAREAQEVLAEVAAGDLAAARQAAARQIAQAPAGLRAATQAAGEPDLVLHRDSLRTLTAARCRLALRGWVAESTRAVPGEAVLLEMHKQLIEAGSAYGEVAHAGTLFQRYRDWLWAGPDRTVPVLPPDPVVAQWQGEPHLDLAGGRLWVAASNGFLASAGGALPRPAADIRLTVKALPSSTRVRLRAGGPSRSLKHWHQYFGVPARLRTGLPGVFVGDRLAFVAGLGTHHEKTTLDRPPREAGLIVRWAPLDPADPRAPLCALQQFEANRV